MQLDNYDIQIEFRGHHGKFEYKTMYSVGADIPSQVYDVIDHGETKLINTGLYITYFRIYSPDSPNFTIPFLDFLPELQIRPRSGLSSKGINCSFGTVDLDYRDEIKVCLTNNSGAVFTVNPGDRIAQLVPALVLNLKCINRLQSERTGGFASTGI
jgi:dUTPase